MAEKRLKIETTFKLPNGETRTFPAGTTQKQIKIAFANAEKQIEISDELLQPNKPKISEGVIPAVKTVAGSTYQLGKDIVMPFLTPIETAKNLGTLGNGIYSMITGGDSADEETAKLVGQFYIDRYGSKDAILNTLNTDPMGFISDAALAFTGGGGLVKILGKTNKYVAKAGNVLSRLGQRIDPLRQAALLSKTGIKSARNVSGLMSGVGSQTLQAIYEIGKSGSKTEQEAFLKALQGSDDLNSIVEDSLQALKGMKNAKQQSYLKELENLNLGSYKLKQNAPYKLTNKIREHLRSFDKKGVSTLSNSDELLRNQILKKLNDFDNNPDLHTLEGLDILKLQIDNLKPSALNKASQSSSLITGARNIVRNELVNNSGAVGKKYKNIMGEYERLSTIESQIVNELSLKGDAVAKKGTVLRKIRSAFTDTGQTSFGVKPRLEHLNTLDKASNMPIKSRIAGASGQPIAPLGLNRILAAPALGTGAYLGATTLGGGPLTTIPTILGAATLSSPRIASNVAYGLGKTTRLLDKIPTEKKVLSNILKTQRAGYGQYAEDDDKIFNR